MKYSALNGPISVGQKYYRRLAGPIYCWESCTGQGSNTTSSLGKLATSLRILSVSPEQLYNKGTKNPPTHKLTDDNFDSLFYRLTRPMTRVLRKNCPGMPESSELNLNHPYNLIVGNSKPLFLRLEEVPLVLQDQNYALEDLLFHEEKEGTHVPLPRLDKLYILMHSGLLPPLTEISINKFE